MPVQTDLPRFTLVTTDVSRSDFAADVRTGLTGTPKSLPPRWFYDALGSSLFDAICFLPEYYVLRAETEIFETRRSEIVAAIGPDVRLVELGSGMARKTTILLDLLTVSQPGVEYAPVDLDSTVLERSAKELLIRYPRMRIAAVRSDLTRPSEALRLLPPGDHARTVVLFLGSTIGNLDPEDAVAMLSDLRAALSPGDALLLGADLRKSKAILEPAYDDALGVTAAFNLNVLGRINRELGGRFDLAAFQHRAFYDEKNGRIEMHLVSRVAQTVRIDALDLEIAFDAGESIHTENSYKHDRETLNRLARQAGFRIEKTWTDARGWFADVLMVVD